MVLLDPAQYRVFLISLKSDLWSDLLIFPGFKIPIWTGTIKTKKSRLISKCNTRITNQNPAIFWDGPMLVSIFTLHVATQETSKSSPYSRLCSNWMEFLIFVLIWLYRKNLRNILTHTSEDLLYFEITPKKHRYSHVIFETISNLWRSEFSMSKRKRNEIRYPTGNSTEPVLIYIYINQLFWLHAESKIIHFADNTVNQTIDICYYVYESNTWENLKGLIE